jgi:NAD(P)-dependent dehydrogenase (short-subunit alcohol dehydrogenase family)
MKVADRVVVVTGGASGIGRALCERCAREGARKVIAADLDGDGAETVARSIDGASYRCDVAQEEGILRLIDETEDRFGPIDLFCSNAGIAAGFDPLSENAAGASNDEWQRSWAVNVMAHVYAARALVPRMKTRGGGYFLNTVSAAGLLSQVGSAVYSTTKHAAVGFAENLAISHRAHGIRVSILCPQGVDTPMLRSLPPGPQALDGVMTAEAVADAAIDGLERETFLILPHPQVAGYMRNKAENYDRWITGMARLQKALRESSAVA